MRPPTTKGTLVTLHDGRVVQAVPATWKARPSCKGCVAYGSKADNVSVKCNALNNLCGSNNLEPKRDDQFIFIDNTPEAFAKYVLQLLGESE